MVNLQFTHFLDFGLKALNVKEQYCAVNSYNNNNSPQKTLL